MTDSVRIEGVVLGCLLIDSSLWDEATALREQDFSLSANQRIFRRMRELAEAGRPRDIITVSDELSRRGELESIGGVVYLSSLLDGTPERPSIADYVDILKDYTFRRAGAKTGDALQKLARDGSTNPIAMAELARRYASEIDTAEDALPPQFSEDALALRFSERHSENLRYVAAWGKWLAWDGVRWSEDATLHVFDKVRTVCRSASSECADDTKQRVATRITSGQAVSAIERLARCDRRHAATTGQWDADSWLLNTPGGVVDLRTGILRDAKREDYFTKCTGATPKEECPLWLAFLNRITGGQDELQQFIQRMCGYILTGTTREHALFFLYGTGANGKSVFINTLSGAMADYAKTAPIEAFIASNSEHHPTDIAGLQGARLVTSIETEDGRRWAESKLKALTGGDRITARFMRQDFFEYTPQFKLIVAGNHKPGLRSVDEAMRRRFNLVPFTVTIPASERDAELTEKLRAEWPGILQWAIDGCLAWQCEGLNAPALVRDATADYFTAEDALGNWLEECCTTGRRYWTSGAALFANWREWCERSGEYVGSQKRFSQALQARGFEPGTTGHDKARGFSGIALREDMRTDADGSSGSYVLRARVTGKPDDVSACVRRGKVA
jgi:putative DNA primase/helicase